MNPRVSKYVEDEDEPIYQTIRTLKSTPPQPQPHASSSASPDLPPDLPPRSSDINKEERYVQFLWLNLHQTLQSTCVKSKWGK